MSSNVVNNWILIVKSYPFPYQTKKTCATPGRCVAVWRSDWSFPLQFFCNMHQTVSEPAVLSEIRTYTQLAWMSGKYILHMCIYTVHTYMLENWVTVATGNVNSAVIICLLYTVFSFMKLHLCVLCP